MGLVWGTTVGGTMGGTTYVTMGQCVLVTGQTIGPGGTVAGVGVTVTPPPAFGVLLVGVAVIAGGQMIVVAVADAPAPASVGPGVPGVPCAAIETPGVGCPLIGLPGVS